MAHRESITAITLVICQSCRVVEERISFSRAPILLLSPPCPPLSANGQFEGADLSLLFPSSGLCGAPQGDGTHSRHSPEATVTPRHQTISGSHWRSGRRWRTSCGLETRLYSTARCGLPFAFYPRVGYSSYHHFLPSLDARMLSWERKFLSIRLASIITGTHISPWVTAVQ